MEATKTPQAVSGFSTEAKIDLYAAQKRCPGNPGFATVWRWAVKGLSGIRLEYMRRGRRMFTSAEALDRFFAALTALDQDKLDAPKPAVPTYTSPRRSPRRERDVNRARQALVAAGI